MKFKSKIFTMLMACVLAFTAQAQSEDVIQKASLEQIGATKVVFLETASWGQNYPFNEQCWISYGGTTHAKTGCVATAHAIVLRYHKYPDKGTENILYNCQAPTYVEITDRVYDWDNMPLVYDGNWNETEIYEVSKIMSHLGHAFFSQYGANGTFANEERETAKLNRYFNYPLIAASYQREYTREKWESKIRESLDNGCPVPYASNNSGTGDSRHMFVIDGYTDNGYFHFNFGWNGSGNGWFKLDNVTPYQGDNYSWKEDGTSEHYANFNLKPAVVEEDGDNSGESGKEEEGSDDNQDNGYQVLDYVISPSTGTPNDPSSYNSSWVYTKNGDYQADLSMVATYNGAEYDNINITSGSVMSLVAYPRNSRQNVDYTTTFTISVPENGDYKITGYSLEYEAYGNVDVKNDINNYNLSLTSGKSGSMQASDLDVYSFSFDVTATKKTTSAAIDIKSFTVTIQKGEKKDQETAVEEIQGCEETETVIYDLTGRRVKEIAESGVYIINGQKVLVK